MILCSNRAGITVIHTFKEKKDGWAVLLFFELWLSACFGLTARACVDIQFADPELPNKVKEGRFDEISPCISCLQSCIGYLGNPERWKISCLVNPCTGHEGEYDLSEAEVKKKVMIAGGGPGGLIAAWVAAKKGHDVHLYEKSGEFGGQFRLAAVPPTKHEIANAIKYYLTMGKKYGVKYHLETALTPELIKAEKPDAVILATGGVQRRPGIKGIDGANIVSCVDVLDAKVELGANVLVVGGGMSGAETADYIAEHNRAVTIIEMLPMMAPDVEYGLRVFLLRRLAGHNVQMHTNTKVLEFLPDGAVVEKNGVREELRGFDSIVLAMGAEPYNPLEEEVRKLVGEVYVVGDAVKVAPANNATETGLAAALSL